MKWSLCIKKIEGQPPIFLNVFTLFCKLFQSIFLLTLEGFGLGRKRRGRNMNSKIQRKIIPPIGRGILEDASVVKNFVDFGCIFSY